MHSAVGVAALAVAVFAGVRASAAVGSVVEASARLPLAVEAFEMPESVADAGLVPVSADPDGARQAAQV
jgi:hypothetical protein